MQTCYTICCTCINIGFFGYHAPLQWPGSSHNKSPTEALNAALHNANAPRGFSASVHRYPNTAHAAETFVCVAWQRVTATLLLFSSFNLKERKKERKKATGTTQLFFLAGFRVFFYPHSYRGSYGTSAHRLDLQLLLQTQQRGCLLSSNEENKEHDVCKAGIV